MADTVCITGASGFVGSHVVQAFLAAGHTVHATVRDPADPRKTAHLEALAAPLAGTLRLFRGDLMEAGSFDEAVTGCVGVVHVAAVARLAAKDPARAIVAPAVEGTRNVFGSIQRAGSVRRVVMTSSVAAVGSYRKSQDHPLTEADWNDEATLETDPYGLAKTRSERLAWELAEAQDLSLVTINPAMILGPVFTKAHTRASPLVVRDLLVGAFPACPKFCFGVVDVRDVAEAHLRAWTRDDAEGRHILCQGTIWMRDIARLLLECFPSAGIRTWQLPNLAMWIGALFDKRLSAATLKDILDREPRYVADRAKARLELDFIDAEEAVRVTARSMVEQGFARPKGG